MEKKEIHKMWDLLLIILPGKRDDIFLGQIEVYEMIGVIFPFICVFINLYSKIDLLYNRRKEIGGSGRWSCFPCGSSSVEVYDLLFDVLIFSHCTIQVSKLMYFDVLSKNILYISHGVVQSGGSVTFIVNGVGSRMATATHYMATSNEIFRIRQ